MKRTILFPELINMAGYILILFGITVSPIFAQVSTPSITVTDDTTNYVSKYEISFQISNGDVNSLKPADNDSVYVVFPSGTILPSEISTSNITIEGTNPSTSTDINIYGQVLAVKVPVLVNGNGNSIDRTVNIVISKSAGIRNPVTAGTTYSIDAYTTPESTPSTSDDYSIFQSTSTVSQASVTPNTSVADRTAEYTIAFQTGDGGYLPSSSTITLDFPASTNIPRGSIAGVTLNGTRVTAVGDAGTTSVDITTPSEILDGETVNIVFGIGAGLINPTSGSYTLDVSSASETTPVASSSYFISNPEKLSFSSVSLSNDTVNSVSQYQIDFIVGDPEGSLTAANDDKIILTFNKPTSIPHYISTSNVTVINQSNGFSNNPSSVTVTDYTDSTHVSFATPIDIGDGELVRVIFDENAGIQNTLLTGSNYIAVKTVEAGGATINEHTQSNAFNTTKTTTSITQPAVLLSNSAANQSSNYTINFNVGDYGRLLGESSSIDLVFPAGTDLTTITSATINSESATYSINTQTLTLNVPSSLTIENSGCAILTINGITNPGESTYSIEVNTSIETSDVLSQSYEIVNSQITVTQTIIGTPLVNNTSSYSFNFSGASKLSAGDNDFIKLIFPDCSTLPSTIAKDHISIGNQLTNSIVVDQDNRIIKVYVDQLNKAPNSITIDAEAGIIHPPVPASCYQVLVATSLDALDSSSSYTLNGNTTSVAAGTVSVTPSVKEATNVEYIIPFTTGVNGRLQGGTAAGSSTITVRFNNNSNSTILPTSINANDVTVNGFTSDGVSVNGDEVTVTVPDGLVIEESSSGTIVFSSAAGFENGTSEGNYTVEVKTSSETAYSTETNNLSLTSESGLVLNEVSRSNSIVNAVSAYTIKFTPGTGNGLAGSSDDDITLTFPNNTYLPASISKSHIMVQGISLDKNPTVNTTARTVNLDVPSSVTIAAETEGTIQFSSSAGIINPTTVGSKYSLQLATNKESAVTSNTFRTTPATSTVSTADVSLSNNAPSATTQYTIDFNTGSYGRLIESGGLLSASTIDIEFPSGTNFGSLSATVNGTNAVVSQSDQVVTVTVPSMVADSIWYSDDVSLVINNVINPSISNDYSLDIKTSVETNYVSSNTYPITSAQPLTTSAFGLTANEVNEAGDYSFDFTVDAAATDLIAGSGTITITFPTSTEVPASISTSDITIDGMAAYAISTVPGNHQVTITTPTTITASQTASLVITTDADILNPKEPDNAYVLNVKTSSQSIISSTSNFTILESSSTKISNLNVSVDPQSTAQPVTWTWSFLTGNQGALQPGVGSIVLDFDKSNFSEVQDPMPTTAFRVNDIQVSSIKYPYQADSSQIHITVPSRVTITNNDLVTITITDAAGIKPDPNLAKSTSSDVNNTTLATNNYYVDTSSEGGNLNEINPLPIALFDLQVTLPSSADEPLIQWSTKMERENFGFFIDRAFLGQQYLHCNKVFADTNWTEIHFVKGTGTTSRESTYQVKDKLLQKAGLYLYRIRQVDYDGNTTLYGPVKLQYESPRNFSLSQNYPNPCNPTTNIEYHVAKQSRVQISVFNSIGQLVQTLVNKQHLPGIYRIQFDGTALSSGVYFIRMQAEGNIMTHKIMLIH
jgi:hypothetical protein